MKSSGILAFILTSFLLASCPLGFPPEEACSSEDPTCTLFVDEDGDALCDNPGPQPDGGSGQTEVEIPPDSAESFPDSLNTEAVSVTDSLQIVPEDTTPLPDESTSPIVEADVNTSPPQEPFEELTPADQPADSVYTVTRITILSDSQGDLFCLNPNDNRNSEFSYIAWEVAEALTNTSLVSREIQVDISSDSVSVDTVTIEEISTPVSECPLGYSPEEACSEDNPFCALFTDANADELCDNPGESTDSAPSVNVHVSSGTYGLVAFESGCPLGLPPEAACPAPDDALCPSYTGWDGCKNPAGAGMHRTFIVIIATFVLLVSATILKRLLRGRRKPERRKRKVAHITVQVISLLVLGFWVQGCFCPLGVVQYALLPGGLLFLGGMGLIVLILPMIWTAFFDRVYCGWVCPFGALQDFLGKLRIPRPPRFSHKVHSILSGFRYLLAVLFLGFIVLTSSGQFESLKPAAFFCRYDPFHSLFSFFLVGSFAGVIASLSILAFFPRFFCKYLCFYGAILSFLGRIGLWKRITHKQHPPKNSGSRGPTAP